MPLGKGKPAAGKFRHDRDAEELEKTIIQQVVAEETGRIALEKTDSFDEGRNPGVPMTKPTKVPVIPPQRRT